MTKYPGFLLSLLVALQIPVGCSRAKSGAPAGSDSAGVDAERATNIDMDTDTDMDADADSDIATDMDTGTDTEDSSNKETENTAASESESQATSDATDSLMTDTFDTDTKTEDSESASSEFHVPEILFNQWHLSSLVYSGEKQQIDPKAQNPTLEILRDEYGSALINASSCYTKLDDYCELVGESEIECSGYRNHSIIWGDDPFPCSDYEMTIEVRFYYSMEAVSSYALQDETLVLFSDDGMYEARFEL